MTLLALAGVIVAGLGILVFLFLLARPSTLGERSAVWRRVLIALLVTVLGVVALGSWRSRQLVADRAETVERLLNSAADPSRDVLSRIADLERAYTLATTSSDVERQVRALLLLAKARLDSGHPEGAKSALEALFASPARKAVLDARGGAAKSDAYEIYSDTLSSLADARLSAGDASGARSLRLQAREAAQSALKLAKGSKRESDLLVKSGALALKLEEFDSAGRDFQQAITLTPLDPSLELVARLSSDQALAVGGDRTADRRLLELESPVLGLEDSPLKLYALRILADSAKRQENWTVATSVLDSLFQTATRMAAPEIAAEASLGQAMTALARNDRAAYAAELERASVLFAAEGDSIAEQHTLELLRREYQRATSSRDLARIDLRLHDLKSIGRNAVLPATESAAADVREPYSKRHLLP